MTVILRILKGLYSYNLNKWPKEVQISFLERIFKKCIEFFDDNGKGKVEIKKAHGDGNNKMNNEILKIKVKVIDICTGEDLFAKNIVRLNRHDHCHLDRVDFDSRDEAEKYIEDRIYKGVTSSSNVDLLAFPLSRKFHTLMVRDVSAMVGIKCQIYSWSKFYSTVVSGESKSLVDYVNGNKVCVVVHEEYGDKGFYESKHESLAIAESHVTSELSSLNETDLLDKNYVGKVGYSELAHKFLSLVKAKGFLSTPFSVDIYQWCVFDEYSFKTKSF